MSGNPKVVWRATIKRATMSQKFDQKGAVHSSLQLQLEGDMLPVEQMTALATLQAESMVTITISPTQMSFSWNSRAEKGEPDAEIPDQDSRGGGNSAAPSGDGPFLGFEPE